LHHHLVFDLSGVQTSFFFVHWCIEMVKKRVLSPTKERPPKQIRKKTAKCAARATLYAKIVERVARDLHTERRTSRGRRPTGGHRYLRPLSAVDAAKIFGTTPKIVLAAIGSRSAVVRRYRQAATQRRRRIELKMAEENGGWT
jgi:hypothetical protein